MSPKPHSRAWLAEVAVRHGGYRHPWTCTLDGPDPEEVFDGLLDRLLTSSPRVLEAGCGHGPDALRYRARAARWVGYDYSLELLALARKNAPDAEFVLWDGKAPPPAELDPPFDLIVSQRGPTSVISHLPALAAPDARFLYVGPGWDVPQARERLAYIGWPALGEWRSRVRAWLPTREDYALMCEFNRLEPDELHWAANLTPRGLPYFEERLTLLCAPT